MTFGVVTATFRSFYPVYRDDYTFKSEDFSIYQDVIFYFFMTIYAVYIVVIFKNSVSNSSRQDKMDPVFSFIIGMMFGIGLVLSGMCRRSKILRFLTLRDGWDPSLAFVMASAVTINFVAFKIIMKKKSPLICSHFSVPSRKDIDFGIIFGPILFGIGWGLTGFCPGPALANMVILPQAGLMVPLIAIGQVATKALLDRLNGKGA